MSSWQIEITHKELGKYRVIKAKDRYEAEQKARAQMIAWNEQYERKLQVNAERSAREARQTARESKRREAERRSIAAADALKAASSILLTTLHIDDRISWDSLKNTQPFGEAPPIPPQEPLETLMPTLVQPERGLLDMLIPSRFRRKLQLATQDFEHRRLSWTRTREEQRARYQREMAAFEQSVARWTAAKAVYEQRRAEDNSAIDAQRERYLGKDPDAVAEYCEMVLSRSQYPEYVPKEFQTEYDSISGTLVIDYLLPSPGTTPFVKDVKYVQSSDSIEERRMKPREIDSLYDLILYEIALRTCHEVFEADVANALHAVVFNGFVNYTDKSNGAQVRSCILSLHADKERFSQVDLSAVEPKQCFRGLKGIASAQLAILAPVAPIVQLKRDDPRFIASESVGHLVQEGTNLASIGWEEFEHLIREIFEREFSSGGAEVKVTRASRDAGVDAVILDPDPIRGGKIVVQAKRYTNTVDVSSVRDLYGTVMNEGASKGILVTTSTFGPDAYNFAKGKPITLLDGSNLLHLLGKHGKSAHIDLKEAKDLGIGLQRRSLSRE